MRLKGLKVFSRFISWPGFIVFKVGGFNSLREMQNATEKVLYQRFFIQISDNMWKS